MNWLLARILVAAGSMGLGAILGRSFGPGLGHAGLLGAALALAAISTSLLMLESARVQRLLGWLSGPMDASAPRGAGPMGEIGYRVERALRARDHRTASEQQRLAQFLSAIEASPNGVLLLDAQDQIQWFNPVAAEHFGLDPLRDRAQRVTNLVRAPVFVAHMQSGLYDEGVSYPNPRGEGTLQVLVRRYGDSMKLVLSQDVTERERSDAMRRDFVANVSHEIRSPLTVLAGFVETMTNLPLTEVERARVLTVMRQQTDRMQSLVTDLLALAQLEGASRPPSDAWVTVSALMRHVESDVRASDHGEHAFRIEPGPPTQINGVESELFSAVWNLTSNALRYTPSGGSVSVHWSIRPDGCGEFCVEDDGVGIPKEHLPRITERFYRVDSSRSRATGGTGLGLAIVKHVLQRHGAELIVQSEPGKGSQFRVVIPGHRVRLVEDSPALASIAA